ncbi:MAG: KH domain-containing protein [Bacilli bacterium]|nr:KH domain-containing protein [Bacilli bacterium]
MIDLTEFLVKSLVVNGEEVSVKEFESDDENTILIQVLVSPDDMGRIIGKGGKIANAVRTLVQASSYMKDNKKIKINIDSF